MISISKKGEIKNIMLDIMIDALIDSLKMLPFLFGAYLLIEYDKTIYPIEIKITANPTKKMAKAFEMLQQLPHNELSIAHGTIINQYPQKLWLAENLVALPITYL